MTISATAGDGPRSSFDRVLDAISRAGVRFTHRGDHIQAQCPAHPDTNPSLSIDYKSGDGKTVLHCQTGCAYDEVLAALDLPAPMLYDDYEDPETFAARRAQERAEEAKSGRKREARRPAKARKKAADRPALPKGRLPKRLTEVESRPLGEWQPIATWEYPDVEGTLIQEEIKYERLAECRDPATGEITEKREKKFSQRAPDGKGGWLMKNGRPYLPEGFKPVLYRLPDLVEWIAEGRRIWLPEGAKDADRFIELGEAATTNPSGAANFKAHQADYLTGAQVTAVLDHDLTGYQRGLKLAGFLRDKVASLQFVLPVTTGRHEDASDHFDAGHGLSDFVPVTVEQLTRLERTAAAEQAAEQARAAAREAAARAGLARKADAGTQVAQENTRHAARWAAETGKHLVKAVTALEDAVQEGQSDSGLMERLMTAVLACQQAVIEAHEVAGEEVSSELQRFLQEPSTVVPQEDEDEETEAPDNVTELRTGQAILPPPAVTIPMSRGLWAYETGGDGRRPRGVYMEDNGRWERIAPLPHVHARIVRRDGSGRPTGTFYLVSATRDGQTVLIGPDEIRSHLWANMLGLPIAQDDKILRAASTAMLFVAEDAELREATPRAVDGRIAQPLPDTMPSGYLTTSDMPREEALEVWREILTRAAENPRLALVMGAAAIAPFIGPLKQQAHVLAIYGDPMQGKTTTLNAAASMWGYPGGEEGAGVLLSWNATTLSVPAFLGDLGVLPAFMDEIGQAGDMKDGQWHQLISNITQGAVRMTRARNKPGVQLGLSWRGIFFSSGNAPMGHGAAGKNSGVPRRMVELSTPFTNSAEHGEAIEELVPTAYGHVGQEILDQHSVETVRPLIARALQSLGDGFPTSHERAMAEHLAAHLAGAQILDDLCGTGGALAQAAVLAAAEFLDDCAPPPHDADRVLEELTDWIAREPGAWPSREQYLALKKPKSFESEALLPQHGFKGEFAGYLEDDGAVMITNAAWKTMTKELDVAAKVALRTLHERGLLRTQESRRRRGEWSIQSRVMGCTVYAIELPEPEDDDPAQTATPAAPDPAPDQGPVGGSDSPGVGGVGGGVGGGNVPLTCGVGGVGGVGGASSRIPARVRDDSFSDPEIVRLDPDAPRPECVVCGKPAGQLVNGHPIHLGPCVDRLAAGADAPSPAAATEQVPSADAADAPEAPLPSTPPRGRREARFTAPAACLTADGVHLADGSVRPWPEVSHLGELAMLTGRDQLRLGWGGGEDRLPDQGQLWLYADALERLGLPTEAPALPDKALTKSQRARVNSKGFAKLGDHPMVAGAVEAGWQFGQGGRLDVWTRIWHPELLPQGAFLVGLPWHRIEGVALFADQPSPGELARRLLMFAQNVGVTYRVTSAATGLDLIDHHRPPRRDHDDDRGASRNRYALVRNTPAELPPWRMKTNDARFNGLEQDFSWWRTWDQLPESEQGRRYVHGYDRNASYLVPWRGIELGAEGLTHRTGDAAAWDGKERPGYYLIDGAWEWPYWGLPDPGTAAGARVGRDRMWVTVHTLKQLKAHGVTPAVHESYTWDVTARYLEGPGQALAQARTTLSAAAGEDPGARDVLATVKSLYTATVGKLAEREHHADFHLWRPDWRDHVIGATKTAILHTLTKAAEISGEHPLVVDRDAIFYASDNPDPVAAWPGDPKKLGDALGSWKPIGTADLAEWGPQHLPKRPGRWHYADAVEAMRGDHS